ncbi:MAG: ribosome-binding factor A [Candidatus Terrybacteria bacterium]|nr:ribosome-binding factor A [Candidatus Terrybacteria bacterium]
MTLRQEKINSLLKELAGSFIKRNILSGAIVTATRAEIFSNLRSAKVFISVFPEDKEKDILGLLKNKEGEFRDFINPRLKIRFLPKVSFEIDNEIKMERHIEELLKKTAA